MDEHRVVKVEEIGAKSKMFLSNKANLGSR